MAAPARDAMAKVEKRRGSVDKLVADRLGYDPNELSQYFSAEQVDALAAAIDNVERGAAMIVGDQTGIGKGRIAAGMLRYAMKKGMTPVFLTEKPDLYGDMYRDLRDIGVPEMLGREPRMFITNAGETITLDEEALSWKQEAEEARRNGEPQPKRRGRFLVGGTAAKVQENMRKIVNGEDIADVIFTTYDQMNTVKGQDTPRRKFLAQIAPQAMLVLDEAHNAGGAAKTGWEKKDAPMNRADFARELAAKAKGVMFSSATYAKRPDVMDLYARTDMGKAVDDPKDLPDLIQRGGVPMQQIVASMLAQSGQYLRRERSFDGVDYQLTTVPVDEKAYKQFSSAMQAIFRFDLEVEDIRKKWGEDKLDEMGFAKSRDDGVGSGSASSISFGSLMHNITNQMLLAIKAEQTAQAAIKAHKAGEKPVIALANTNESFIKDFAEGEGIKAGQPLDLNFSAVLERYLQRTLRITVKSPEGDRTHIQMPVDELPMSLRQEYREAMNQIKAGKWDSLPISPIDWIRYRLGEAGISVREVTGRQTMIDYSKDVPTYTQRPKSEMGASGKRGSIAAFNSGKLDVLVLNRSGSTGVSMHASENFKDQRKRRMIIAQPEGNIDTHCLDAQTEILTPQGFKGINDAFETVAAFDPATGVVTWQPVTGRVERPLGPNETMFGIQGPQTDVRVSDQHRMLMKHRKKSIGWRLELASDLGTERRGNWRMPVSGVQIPAEPCSLTDHELHFIGWVLTDGTINYQSRQIVIWQAEHQPHHDHIKACLAGCGFKYGMTENRGETQHNRNSRSIGYTISLGQWRHLREYLDKDFPMAFERLDRRQLSVLLEAIHLGDGSKQLGQYWVRRSYHIATGRKTFAERLQSLCVRRGFRCNISEMHYNKNPLYMVRIKDKNEQCIGGKNHNDGRPTFGPVDFEAGETVWCVENPVGTLITRRNGKVAFLGNCQMLGRVHRTGQVVPPAFTQVAADIPAEARPTAVLMKKMASLNANTTGARSSAFTVESVDFINEVGDKVVADILLEDPELNEKLGEPLTFDDTTKAPKVEDVARKATGRLVLLDPDVQAKFLDQVQKAYVAEVEQLDALGENPLEAKTVDLQAKTLETSELKPTQGNSPFLDAVRLEKVTAKAQGRAMPPSEVAGKVADFIKAKKPDTSNPAQALAALEAQGRTWKDAEVSRVSSLIRQQMAQEVAETKPEHKEATRRRLEAQHQRFLDTFAVAYPGARITLGTSAGDVQGVVMSVERTGKAKQMGALGSWTVKMAVADSMRQIDFPMSKLFPQGTPKSEDEKGATIARSGISHADMVQAFEDARREGRETRYVVTGNILGGFDQTRGRGRIVNFTNDKGELRPGILMGREFSAEKFMDSRAVRFREAGHMSEFLQKAPLAKIESKTGEIELSQYRDGYRIEMSSARAKAGQFFTDKAVRDALGGADFQKRGSRMVADELSKAQFEKAVAEMAKIGAKFEVRDQQDLAQSIVAKPGPATFAVQSPVGTEQTRKGREFKSVIPDVRQAMGAMLQRGKAVSIRGEIVTAVHRATEDVYRMVPRGTNVFALSRVEPTGNGDQVVAMFEDRDGNQQPLVMPWRQISSARAFYFDGGIFFVRLNMRALRTPGDFNQNVAAELGHEVIHALRRNGTLTGPVWGALLAHAKALRLLDTEARTYARIVGDPAADLVAPVSVRSVYEQVYTTRSDRAELLDQEEVAHMLEWYLRGQLSPMEVAPVRDTLEAIAKGELVTPDLEGGLERDMAFAASGEGIGQRRDLDRLGFYSKALEAAKDLRQAKGTPEQMRAMLRTAGVKEAELKATGLDDWLAERARGVSGEEAGRADSNKEAGPQRSGDRSTAQPSNRRAVEPNSSLTITRDEIVQYLRDNRVEVREGLYRGPKETWQERVARERMSDDDLMQALEAPIPEGTLQQSGPAKWASYSIDPSNPTYRETVIHLADPTSNTFRLSAEALDRIDLRLRELDARASGFDGQGLPEAEQSEYRELTAQRRAHAEGFDRSERSVFRSGHWSEPNVIAHARTSLQKTSDGKTVFLVDELQSDWGQKIRDGGIRDEAKVAELQKAAAEADAAWQDEDRWDEARSILGRGAEGFNKSEVTKEIRRYAAEGDADAKEWVYRHKTLSDTLSLAKAELETAVAATPGHPLVNTTDQWTTTAFRRLIRQAVEAGADYIALTPGKVQNERFSLSRVVREIEVERGPGLRYVYLYGPSGDNISRIHVNDEGMVTDGHGAGSPLTDLVGRDLAAKIMGVAEKEVLKTADIEIGGSGMKATYDSIYPRTLSKLLSKMDKEAGKMADQALKSSVDGRMFDANTGRTPQTIAEKRAMVPIQFHTFPLTDKVKESVMEEGQPLFAIAGVKAKGAPLSSRNLAESMERKGRKPEQILKDTGWFRGPDTKWRFEIDDSKAALKNLDAKLAKPQNSVWRALSGKRAPGLPSWAGNDVRLGLNLSLPEILTHDKLFKAYPFLHKMRVSVVVGPGVPASQQGGALMFRRVNGGIVYDPIQIKARTQGEILPNLMHELQHYIQHKEGFAEGSNTTGREGDFATKPLDYNKSPSEQLSFGNEVFSNTTARAMGQGFGEITDWRTQIAGINNAEKLALAIAEIWKSVDLNMTVTDSDVRGLINHFFPETSRILHVQAKEIDLPFLKDKALPRLQAELMSALRVTAGDYLNSAGEAEANAVMDRLNYTPEQRRTMLPNLGKQLTSGIVTRDFRKVADAVLESGRKSEAIRDKWMNDVVELGDGVLVHRMHENMLYFFTAENSDWQTELSGNLDWANGRAVLSFTRDALNGSRLKGAPGPLTDARMTQVADAAERYVRSLNLLPTADRRLLEGYENYPMEAREIAFWKNRDPFFEVSQPVTAVTHRDIVAWALRLEEGELARLLEPGLRERLDRAIAQNGDDAEMTPDDRREAVQIGAKAIQDAIHNTANLGDAFYDLIDNGPVTPDVLRTKDDLRNLLANAYRQSQNAAAGPLELPMPADYVTAKLDPEQWRIRDREAHAEPNKFRPVASMSLKELGDEYAALRGNPWGEETELRIAELRAELMARTASPSARAQEAYFKDAAGSLIPRITPAQQATVSRDVSEAINIVNRIAGKDVEVRFQETIDAGTVSSDQRQATERAGFQSGNPLGAYRRASLDAGAVIMLATSNEDLLTTAGHEAWHHVEEALASPAELRLLTSAPEMRRMRAAAGQEIGIPAGDPRLDALPDAEIRAIAFQKYRREKEEGGQPQGFHIGVRRFFDRMMRILAVVRNALNKHGLKSYEDVFEAARTGKMAQRGARFRPADVETIVTAWRDLQEALTGAPLSGTAESTAPGSAILSRSDASERVRSAARQYDQAGADQIPTAVNVAPSDKSAGFSWRKLRYYSDKGPLLGAAAEIAARVRDGSIKSTIQNVPIASLRTPQKNVSAGLLERKIAQSDLHHEPRFPIVVRGRDGSFTVHDGNHRIQARAFRGYSHIRAHVIDEQTILGFRLRMPPDRANVHTHEVPERLVDPASRDAINAAAEPDGLPVLRYDEAAHRFTLLSGAREFMAEKALGKRLIKAHVVYDRPLHRRLFGIADTEVRDLAHVLAQELEKHGIDLDTASSESALRAQLGGPSSGQYREGSGDQASAAEGVGEEEPSPNARNDGTFGQDEGASVPSSVSGQPLDMSPAAKKARAEAMGFDTSHVLYNGSFAKPAEFTLGHRLHSAPVEAVWFSPSSKRARWYAVSQASILAKRQNDSIPKPQWFNLWRKPTPTAPTQGYVGAYYIRPGRQLIIDMSVDANQENVHGLLQQAKADGYDSVVMRGHRDTPEIVDGKEVYLDEVLIFNPADARSTDAAFDPAESDSAQLMASLIPRAIQQSVNQSLARLQPRLDRLRVGIQDKFLPVRRIQEEKERQTGTRIPINLDTYVSEALFHGRAGEQTADLKADFVDPLVEILRKADISKEAFDDYLYARHARERNAAIAQIDPSNTAGSGMTDQEADAILIAARGKQAAYDQATNLVDTMLEETRKRLLRAGLIDRETFDQWQSQYAHYVPLRGWESGSEDDVGRARTGRGFDIRGPEAMQALGRRSKADSPLGYALLQAQQAIIRAEKNRVDKTLYRFIQAYPDPSLYAVFTGEARRRVNPTTSLIETYWVPPAFVRQDNIHGVKIGGKQYYMELRDPQLARAMRGVQGEQHNAVLRGMMWLSRTYAQLLTSYNPEFVVSNFLRDIQTALMNVTDVADKPEGVRRQMVKDAMSLKSIRGVMNALRGDGNSEFARWFEEYRQAGGKISFMEYNDVERIQTDINKSIERGRFNRVTRKAFEFINDLNTAVENGVRLSVYAAMRKSGISQDRAAFVARELTVNFNRKGEWSPVINSMYLFFNASVQGTTRMAQAIAKSRTLQVGVASIMGLAFMTDWWNYLIAGDDDDGKNRYDKIPNWIKERNLIVMTGRKDGSYLQIPMPYGYNLFWFGSQQTGAAIRGAVKPWEAAKNVAGAMLEVLSPIGGAQGSVAQMVAPTMVDPFVQVIENKTWYGGPIYPTKFNKKQPDSETYFSSAPSWAIDIARTLNRISGGNSARSGTIDISPEVLQHFFEFAGGGVAKFIGNVGNTATRAYNGQEWLPEKTPFIRRVYGKATTESRRRDFYKEWEEVDAAKYEVDNLIKNTRRGKAERDEIVAAREKYAVELQAYASMKATRDQLGAMRKQRAEIELNRTLSSKEKEERLQEIQARENGIILRSLGTLNRIRKDAKQAKEKPPALVE